MSNKICLIHHSAGIGDVFFLQYIARKYISMGYHVIWPLENKILWIKDYISDIQFCSVDDNFPGKEYYGQDLVIISPQFVYLGITRPHLWDINLPQVMPSKYQVLNLDCMDWAKGFQFNRNLEKEDDLYYNVLGLKDDSEYIFVNRYSNTENRRFDGLDYLKFNLPTVELEIKQGYTLFDWCKVFENAQEIHTVHTSLNYLIDKLDIKCKKYLMYQGNHHPDVKYIPFSKNPTFIPR